MLYYPEEWIQSEFAQNPTLEADVLKTFADFGIFTSHPHLEKIAKRMSPGSMGNALFPYASYEKLRVLTTALVLFYLYDDVVEGHGESEVEKIVDAITGKDVRLKQDSRAFVRLMAYIGCEYFAHMPIEWNQRIEAGMRKLISSDNTEADLLSDKEHPDVETYMAWRRVNMAGLLMADLVEYELGFVLPEPWLKNEHVQQIRNTWSLINLLQNDYISAISGRDKGKLNLAWAFAKMYNVDEKSAIEMVLQQHNEAVRLLVSIESNFSILASGNHELQAWGRHMRSSFVGYGLYQQRAARDKKDS